MIHYQTQNATPQYATFNREEIPDDWTIMVEDDEIINPELEAMEIKAAKMYTGSSVQASNVLTIQV